MKQIIQSIRNYLTPAAPLPTGMYHYQSPPGMDAPYRMHLRLEADGGVLILNASTVLHLNQTAAEYAYHWVNQTPPETAVKEISSRYRVNRKRALEDFKDFKDRVQILLESTDLDPVSFLDFQRQNPHAIKLTAPLRLDCALTYLLPDGQHQRYAPVDRAKSELSTDEWKLVLDKAWKAGIPHIVFTGGEPVLRDDLPELIMAAESIGQVCGVLSGSPLWGSQDFLSKLLDCGLDHLMFLLTPDEEDSWTAVKNAMAADLFTTVHITLDKKAAPGMGAILERLAAMEVKSLSVSASDPQGAEALEPIRNRIAELGIDLHWDLPVPYSAANPVSKEIGALSSGAGKSWLYVEPDGDVLPEQGVNVVLGNMAREPWETIWRNAGIRVPAG